MELKRTLRHIFYFVIFQRKKCSLAVGYNTWVIVLIFHVIFPLWVAFVTLALSFLNPPNPYPLEPIIN